MFGGKFVAWRRREPVARPAMLAVMLWDGVPEDEYVATSLSCDAMLDMEASHIYIVLLRL